MSPIRLATTLALYLFIVGIVLPDRNVEAGRIQDFIQNLVNGRNNDNSNTNNSNNNNNSGNSNTNANSNSESSTSDSNDPETAASGESTDQSLTPMMSAMNPFMRYPFYFNPSSFGAYPGMSSFQNPMSAMSSLSPMTAALSTNSMGGAFSPSSFGAASFGSFGSTSGSPMTAFGGSGGMSASTLNNLYASPTMMGGYTPYYGRRR